MLHSPLTHPISSPHWCVPPCHWCATNNHGHPPPDMPPPNYPTLQKQGQRMTCLCVQIFEYISGCWLAATLQTNILICNYFRWPTVCCCAVPFLGGTPKPGPHQTRFAVRIFCALLKLECGSWSCRAADKTVAFGVATTSVFTCSNSAVLRSTLSVDVEPS